MNPVTSTYSSEKGQYGCNMDPIAICKKVQLLLLRLFSRKMINKNIKKILDSKKIKKVGDLKLNLRPSEIAPHIYYKITEMYEKE